MTVATIEFTFSFIKKPWNSDKSGLEYMYIFDQLLSVNSLISIIGLTKIQSRRIFNLSLILILILKSFVNTGP